MNCLFLQLVLCRFQLPFKPGFHMIADRRSQIAIRSAIVCDRLRSSAIIWKLLLRSSAILRSQSQTIAEDRTMFNLKAGFHMIADDRRHYCDLRSAICDPRSYGNQPLKPLERVSLVLIVYDNLFTDRPEKKKKPNEVCLKKLNLRNRFYIRAT